MEVTWALPKWESQMADEERETLLSRDVGLALLTSCLAPYLPVCGH